MKNGLRLTISIVLTCALVFTSGFSVVTAASKSVKKLSFKYPTAKTYKLPIGEKSKFKIKASPKGASKAVKWKSSNTKIATVNSKGVVKAKKAGTVKITATSKSNKKIKAVKKVKVVKHVVSGVSIKGQPVVGTELTANITPAKSKVKYTWYTIENKVEKVIPSATTNKYTPIPADKGKGIKVVAEGTGSYTGKVSSKAVTILEKEEAFASKIDGKFALDVIQNMTSYDTHESLGFRMAGSQAERDVANYLYKEYKEIGLENVTMDKFNVDSWEFKSGTFKYTTNGAIYNELELSSYQSTFQTDGTERFEMIYAGYGTVDDYNKLKEKYGDDFIKGKVVLLDTDLYNKYWLGDICYEAYVQGAKAVITCENPEKKTTGLGQYSDDSLQMFDPCTVVKTPILNISRNSREALLDGFEKDTVNDDGILKITLNVDSKVTRDQESQNVWGEIPGKSDETIIVMAHYDSHFNEAADNADGVSINMAMAKAIIDSGIVPEKTIRIIAHGAEEWGKADTLFDWQIGAASQIMEVHPEWAKDTFVAVNVDSFTLDNRDGHTGDIPVRIDAEQLNDFAGSTIKDSLPEGFYLRNNNTVSNKSFEDFSYKLQGIPTVLFARTDNMSQLETYHTSFDNFDTYSNFLNQDKIVDEKIQIIGNAVLAFDKQLIKPMNFASFFETMDSKTKVDNVGINDKATDELNDAAENAKAKADDAATVAKKLDKAIVDINKEYSDAVAVNDTKTMKALEGKATTLNSDIYKMYKGIQKTYKKLNAAVAVAYPHERYQTNLASLDKAKTELEKGTVSTSAAMTAMTGVDTNIYATIFSERSYDVLLKNETKVDAEVIQWGLGLMEETDTSLYDPINALKYDKAGAVDDAKRAVNASIKTNTKYLLDKLDKITAGSVKCKTQMNNLLSQM